MSKRWDDVYDKCAEHVFVRRCRFPVKQVSAAMFPGVCATAGISQLVMQDDQIALAQCDQMRAGEVQA